MAGPRPNKVNTSTIVNRFLKFSQTSVYRVKVQPPFGVQNFMNRQGRGFDYGNDGRDIEFLCTEASLPGTTLATHDVTADFQGVTEKMAYRRIYDENLDLSFYVDKKYNVIEFFEGWIDYISGVGRNGTVSNYKSTPVGYRMSYPSGPSGYKSNIYLTKFEKDLQDNQLQYTFVDAFPISINSSGVSYSESDVLRYNVSFSYVRYVRERRSVSSQSQSQPTYSPNLTGGTVVGVINTAPGLYQVDRLVNGQIVTTIETSAPPVASGALPFDTSTP